VLNLGSVKPKIVKGDLLDQPVEVIVNAWNRNIIPWWLLLPQGVSGAIKRRGGFQPFRELGKMGAIPLGSAVLTNPGKLNFRAIIHVAGINMWWRSSEFSIQQSVVSAMNIVKQNNFKSVAFPIIGSGSGSFNEEKALAIMLDAIDQIDSTAEVVFVRYSK
jgi:O-acetyl-ADP-ribose deacetylase (regulator of RNase III)